MTAGGPGSTAADSRVEHQSYACGGRLVTDEVSHGHDAPQDHKTTPRTSCDSFAFSFRTSLKVVSKPGPHYTPLQPPFKSLHGDFCYLFH